MNAKQALLDVLRETRGLLALPDNDFGWSAWNNAAEALSDLDSYIAHIEAGHSFDGFGLSALFGPTGRIQEVSLSSGWGDTFLQVAERFDSAFAQYEKV